MHKVICEEPRHGGGRKKFARRANLADEFLPKFEGMRRPHRDRKEFGEHLGPLRRWLRSQIGRPWDQIYGEASAVIKPDSVVRNHIKFHLLEFVHRHTFLRDGKVWCFTAGWRGNEMPIDDAASSWSPFFIHPGRGLLCEVPLRPRSRWCDRSTGVRDKTQRWVNERTLLRQLNGIWFECTTESFLACFMGGDEPVQYDFAERRVIDRDHAQKVYGKHIFCSAKRQLSRWELRKFNLANFANGLDKARH